jgi:hypothetical protein
MEEETRTYKREFFYTEDLNKIGTDLRKGDNISFSHTYLGNVKGFFDRFDKTWFGKPYIEVGMGCEDNGEKLKIRGIERFFISDISGVAIIRESPVSDEE